MLSIPRPRSVGRDSLGSVASALAGQGLLLLSGVIVARILGPEERGNLATLSMVAVLIGALGSAGLPTAYSRFLAARSLPVRQGVRSAIQICGIQILILILAWSGVVLLAFPRYFATVNLDSAWWGLLAAPGLLATSYGIALLQGMKQFPVLSVLRVCQPGIYLLLLAPLLFNPSSWTLYRVMLAWSVASGLVGAGFLIAALYVSRRESDMASQRPVRLRELVRFGGRSLVGNLNPLEALRLDQLILALMFAPHVLGYYVVAQAFTNLPRLIAYSVGLVLFPTFAAENEASARAQLFRTSLLLVTSASAAIVLALIALMPALIPLLFGDEFVPSASIAQLLLVGAFFGAVRKTVCDMLVGSGHASAGTVSELAMYPVLGIGVALLAPSLLGMGVALAVVGSQLVSLLTALLLARAHQSKR